MSEQNIAVAARAYDNAGNVVMSTNRIVTVANSVPRDTAPSTVTLTAPSAGSTVSGAVALQSGRHSRFRAMDRRLELHHPRRRECNRHHARGRPPGNETETPPAPVTIDNVAGDSTPPVRTAGSHGTACSTAWYTKIVAVALAATDSGGGVGQIRCATDGTTQNASTGTTYSTALSLSAVRFRAYDKAGNAEAVNVPVPLIDVQAPTGVAITAPGSGASVTGTVSITTVSTDNVGAVRVRFFLHGVQLGSRVTQPLHWSWDTTTTGKGDAQLMHRGAGHRRKDMMSAPFAVTVT
jgi:hypothetical protein